MSVPKLSAVYLLTMLSGQATGHGAILICHTMRDRTCAFGLSDAPREVETINK